MMIFQLHQVLPITNREFGRRAANAWPVSLARPMTHYSNF